MKLISNLLSLTILVVSCSFAQQNIWEPAERNVSGSINTLAINQNDIIFVGTGLGQYKSTDNGDSWININNGLQGINATSILINSSDDIIIGTNSGIFKSTNEGEEWIELNPPLPNTGIGLLGINSNDLLFSAIYGHGVYRSADDGENWELISDGLNHLNFIQLYISKSGPTKDYIFLSVGVIGEFNNFYRSTDYGNTWQAMNFFINYQWIQAFTSTTSGDVYFGTEEFWPLAQGGIFKSTDFGLNWLFSRSANVSYLLTDYNDFVYAVTGGIIRSSNSGNDWESFYSGLPQGNVNGLAINSQGRLFTSYQYRIYRTIESTTDVRNHEVEIPEQFKLFQNYPNPFNPSTIIKYQLPQSGKVNLKVYDLVGKEITTLIDEEKSAGSYEITFDASTLPSGVYFYTLKTGNFKETRKMILLR